MSKISFIDLDVDAIIAVREQSILVVMDDGAEIFIPRSNLSWKCDNSITETSEPTTIQVAEWWLKQKGM